MIPTGAAALIGVLATPTASYGKRAAARQEQIQLRSLINQQQDKSLLQDQQADAAITQYQQLLASQRFEGADVKKMNAFLKNEFDVTLKNRLRDEYKGRPRDFLAAEGEQFFNNVAGRLVATPEFQQAVQNREAVDRARKAIESGEVVTGAMDADTKSFITGERALAEFLGGSRETFKFLGSYKPQDDLKGIRERYAPGKMPWEIVAATPADIQNELVANHGAVTALDKYLRQYQGVSVPYKYDSISKKVEAQQAEAKLNMATEGHQLRMKLGAETSLLNQQKLARNAAKMAEELDGVSGQGFESAVFDGVPDQTLQLPGLGANMGKGYQGKDTLFGHTLHGKGAEVIKTQLGLTKEKDGYTASDLGESYTLRGDKINLSGRQLTVTSVEPKVYSYAGDRVRDAQGKTRWGPDGLRGFAKMTVSMSHDEAEKLDLYDPNTFWINQETKKGAGIYDPERKTLTIIKPIGRVDRNSGNRMIHALQNAEMGQKAANDYQSLPGFYNMGIPGLED